MKKIDYCWSIVSGRICTTSWPLPPSTLAIAKPWLPRPVSSALPSSASTTSSAASATSTSWRPLSANRILHSNPQTVPRKLHKCVRHLCVIFELHTSPPSPITTTWVSESVPANRVAWIASVRRWSRWSPSPQKIAPTSTAPAANKCSLTKSTTPSS